MAAGKHRQKYNEFPKSEASPKAPLHKFPGFSTETPMHSAWRHKSAIGITVTLYLTPQSKEAHPNQRDYGDYVICACCRDVTHSREGGKTQAALLTMHNRRDRYISTKTALGGADIGWGKAHEKRVAKSR